MLRKLFPSLLATMFVALLPSSTSAQTYTQIYSGFGTSANTGPMIQAADGNFYGSFENSAGDTVLFKLTPSGEYTMVHDFGNIGIDMVDAQSLSDGISLIQGGDGNIYGTSSEGGYYDAGAIFQLTPAGDFQNIYSFCSVTISNPDGSGDQCSDGQNPHGIIEGSDANFYGATPYGGPLENNNLGTGTFYKVTSTGTLTQFDFYPENFEGYGPLVQASDGNFHGDGIAFSLSGQTVNSEDQELYNLGGSPVSGLVEAADGNLYAISSTPYGPTCNYFCGEVFQLELPATAPPDGVANVTYKATNNVSLGYAPLAPASDGNLYAGSWSDGSGSFFQVVPPGTVTQLTLPQADGGLASGIIQGSDGSFYGEYQFVEAGNTNGVLRITPSTPLAAPVSVSLNDSSIDLGSSVTVTWGVSNAYSITRQQCYGFSTLSGTLTALGKMTGTLTDGVYGGAVQFTPASAGVYSLAVTCGGTESGFATLTVSSAPIKFTAVTHNFGSLQVGESGTFDVKVTNPNTAAFPFHLALSGPSSFTSATNCGSSLPAAASCEIAFKYQPAAAGTQTATWSLTAGGYSFAPSNGGKLTGTGAQAGSLNYTTSVHNFGTVAVNSGSPVYGTVLTNSYSFPVTLAYTMSGSTTSFAATTNCGATLAAGQSCNADFTFRPKTTGFLTESIGVKASYNSNSVPVTSLGATITGITLKGTGN